MIDLLLYYFIPMLVGIIPCFSLTTRQERFEIILIAIIPIGNSLWAIMVITFGVLFYIGNVVIYIRNKFNI